MDKEQLIKKWLNNDLSDSEARAFNALEDAEFYREIIQEAKRFDGQSNAKVPSFDAVKHQFAPKTNLTNHWIKIATSIAAALVIGFSIFTILDKDQISTFETGIAQKQTITLPDNSIVELNEFSELTYNASQWEDLRHLELEGEAFFDVEKGEQFEVKTPNGIVTVLGTEFNVLSRDRVFQVSCYEGLVQVTYRDESLKLPAGSAFTITNGMPMTTQIAIAEPYWLKNMSVFKNASFGDVVIELEKHYEIKLSYPPNLDLQFTGAFEHDQLENALKSITIPFNLTYKITNNQLVIIENGEN